jgi:hypothetical protein
MDLFFVLLLQCCFCNLSDGLVLKILPWTLLSLCHKKGSYVDLKRQPAICLGLVLLSIFSKEHKKTKQKSAFFNARAYFLVPPLTRVKNLCFSSPFD